MKERIINNYGAELKNICNGCAEGVKAKCKQTQKDHLQCALQKSELEEFEVEKYPTTWEELKDLCKKLEPKLVKENSLYETQITLNINKGGYYAFYPDGTIIFKASNSINYTIAKNRTMLQMFQFIKTLIGEES